MIKTWGRSLPPDYDGPKYGGNPKCNAAGSSLSLAFLLVPNPPEHSLEGEISECKRGNAGQGTSGIGHEKRGGDPTQPPLGNSDYFNELTEW